MPVALSLDGKVALITGGSRGIGAATVRMFVAAGARVFFNYEKAQEAAEKLVRECGEANCVAMQCNLQGTETASALVSACVRRFGRIDILVANHGVWPAEPASIDQMADEQWRRTVGINLDSVFGLVKSTRSIGAEG
jgi:3-oxoacyl-[acyl-carrier protein] reductase